MAAFAGSRTGTTTGCRIRPTTHGGSGRSAPPSTTGSRRRCSTSAAGTMRPPDRRVPPPTSPDWCTPAAAAPAPRARSSWSGPWTHGDDLARTRAGSGDGAAASLNYDALVLDWMDRWVRAWPTEWKAPPVRLYAMGAGEWRSAEAWPPPEWRRSLYLGGEAHRPAGRLYGPARSPRRPRPSRPIPPTRCGLIRRGRRPRLPRAEDAERRAELRNRATRQRTSKSSGRSPRSLLVVDHGTRMYG